MTHAASLSTHRFGSLLVLGVLLATAAGASTPKEPRTSLEQRAFFRPELYISSSHVPLEEALVHLPSRVAWEGFLLARGEDPGRPRTRVYIDPRSGTAASFIGSFPLIPGDGVGNQLGLAELSARLGTPVQQVDAQVVGSAIHRFIVAHKGVLGVEL
jgi:hypothetical protein